MIVLWAATVAEAGRYGALRKAADAGRVEKLVKALKSPHVYFREVACRGLSRAAPTDSARDAVRARLEDGAEAGPVRAQCAVALGAWGDRDAVGPILAALPDVDAESRYWMAWSLHALGTAEAHAQLRELANDPDLYVAASAREWAP